MRQRYERWVCDQCGGKVKQGIAAGRDYADRPALWVQVRIEDGPQGRSQGDFCSASCAARWVEAHAEVPLTTGTQ